MTPIFTVSWAMAPPAQARPRPSAAAAAVLAVMRTSSLLSPRVSGPAALCRPRLHTRAASRQEGCGRRLTSAAARRQARGQRPAPRRVAHGASGRIRHGPKEPGTAAAGDAEHGRDAAQLADRRLCLSGGAERVHQLARRAAGLARDGGALRPVAPHGRADGRGAGRLRDAAGPRRPTASPTSR